MFLVVKQLFFFLHRTCDLVLAVAKGCRLRCLQVTKDRSRARALCRAHHVAAGIVLVCYAEDLALQLICGYSLALLSYDLQAELPYLLIGQVLVLVALA